MSTDLHAAEAETDRSNTCTAAATSGSSDCAYLFQYPNANGKRLKKPSNATRRCAAYSGALPTAPRRAVHALKSCGEARTALTRAGRADIGRWGGGERSGAPVTLESDEAAPLRGGWWKVRMGLGLGGGCAAGRGDGFA